MAFAIRERKKKLLQEAGLTLQRCIDTCRSTETTATQMKAMSGKEDVNTLSQRTKQGSRGKNKSRPKFVECKYCGRKHKRSRGKCIAFGKERTKCGKANHLANVCRQENPSPKKERKERFINSAPHQSCRIQATRNTASLSLSKAQKNMSTTLTAHLSNQRSSRR